MIDFNCALTDLARTRAVCTPTKGLGDGPAKPCNFTCPTPAGPDPLWKVLLEAPTESGLSLCEFPRRRPSRLVATAAEDRLSFRRNANTSFAAASDCRTIAIYEYTPLESVRKHQ